MTEASLINDKSDKRPVNVVFADSNKLAAVSTIDTEIQLPSGLVQEVLLSHDLNKLLAADQAKGILYKNIVAAMQRTSILDSAEMVLSYQDPPIPADILT